MSESRTKLARRKALREQRKTERTIVNGKPFHPDAPHGTSYGYSNFHCRCTPCIDSERKRRNTRLHEGPWTLADSTAVDNWARSIPNRTPIPTADLQLAAYIRNGAAA